MDSTHEVTLHIVTPEPHARVSLSKFSAVLVWTGTEHEVVNNPIQAFIPASGKGVTVQGQYGSGTTVRSRHEDACIVAATDDQDGSIRANWSGLVVTDLA